MILIFSPDSINPFSATNSQESEIFFISTFPTGFRSVMAVPTVPTNSLFFVVSIVPLIVVSRMRLFPKGN